MDELIAKLVRELPLIPIPVFECGVLLLLGGILKQLVVIRRMLKEKNND